VRVGTRERDEVEMKGSEREGVETIVRSKFERVGRWSVEEV